MKELSPYRASKIASEILGKDVAPQQLYGAVRAGKLEARRNEQDHLLVTDVAVTEWAENKRDAEIARKAKKEAKSLQESVNELDVVGYLSEGADIDA